ncbi:MAG: Fic family protein [Tahibacter sp.]
MPRTTGKMVEGTLAETRYRAFVPDALPPVPPLDFSPALIATLEKANQALGRLDGISLLLPDPHVFLYHYVRKEALLSSQIEGTQSSLSDLLLFELDEMPGVPVDDVEEVSNYIAALNHGLHRLRVDQFPLSLRLIREMHAELLKGGRGANQQPGEFRTQQNWIGGRTPATAMFVPPPPDHLAACLDALEKFLHLPPEVMPPLIKAALAHVQFETIHPFLDGNGRLGRLLIVLSLCNDQVLREPTLYLSLYFKLHRAAYYEQLDRVRRVGDWEGWLEFFLDGVASTSQQAVESAQRILALLQSDRARVAALGRRAGNALQVFDCFAARVILNVPQLDRQLAMTKPTARAAIATLGDLGILNEITGQQRNRMYVYQAYYDILSEGAHAM